MEHRRAHHSFTSSTFPFYRLAAGGILLAVFTLFLYHLDAQSLWYDEAVSARLASMSIPHLIRWTAHDIQPPLYYLLLRGWTTWLGRSEWALRFFSAGWAVLAVALMYPLARRLVRSRGGGVVAMMLLGGAPWMVYYAQEARMYTMLLATSMAWAYLLLRKARRLLFLVLLGWALMYTHYFALFFMLALIMWDVGCGDGLGALRTRLRFWIWGGTLLLLGYMPWLPFLLHRFRVDASYWQGRLKVGEALRHWFLHLSLGAPETFLERAALRWLPFFLGVTALGVGVHLWVDWRKRTERRLPRGCFLLFWWLVPTFSILFLAYRTPKFNPRYLMVGYPAWILVLATLPFLLRSKGVERYARWAMGAAVAGVFLMFARADVGWFTDPAFTKPDFRGAVKYVQDHRGEDEIVFLVSGHMSPVVDYYADRMPYTRFPDVDVLDVTHVLDFDVAPRVNQAISGHTGVWLILWQDQVVDPMGIVPYLLTHAGWEDKKAAHAFWHVRVRHFRLPPHARVPQQPHITHPTHVNWQELVHLLGVEQEKTGDIILFFQAQRPIQTDLSVHLELWDEEGHVWGHEDARAGPYLYPSFRWPPGQVVLARYPSPAIAGTPAGTYTLHVRLYDVDRPSGLEILDAFGRPQGRDAIIPRVKVPRTVPATDGGFPPLPPGISVEQTAGWNVQVDRAVQPAPQAVRVWPAPPWMPGQPVHVQIRWRSSHPPQPVEVVRWQFRQAATKVQVALHPLAKLSSPRVGWPEEGVFFTQMRVRVPSNLTPGWWEICASVEKAGKTEAVFSLGAVEITSASRTFTPPHVRIPVGAVFGETIRLVGVDVDSKRWLPGGMVPITVTWEALAPIDRSYTAFVHVLGPNDHVLAQEDHVPGRGRFPTDTWVPGQFVQDRFDVVLPDTLPEEITLEIGMYDANRPGMPRIPVRWDGPVVNDAVRISPTTKEQ